MLIVDPVEGCFDKSRDCFNLISVRDIELPDRQRMLFQYSPYELCCALKPFLCDHLFRKYRLDKLIYLDADILVLDDLTPIFRLLDDYPLVVTPHVLEPFDDGRDPGETAFLHSGLFNLGCFGVTRHHQAFLRWWSDRLRTRCSLDPRVGPFCDQKWVDLVVNYFEDTHILRNPEYNVAYWNLHERPMTRRGDQFVIQGDRPCRFFHFSGYDPNNPTEISRYQKRFTFDQLGGAGELLGHYLNLLRDAEYTRWRSTEYSFAKFDNGVPIPDCVRNHFLRVGRLAWQGENPFRTAGPRSYWNWLIRKSAQGLSPLWEAIHQSRPDLPLAFPDPAGVSRDAFAAWVHGHAVSILKIPPALMNAASATEPIVAAPASPKGPTRGFGVNYLGYLHSEKGMGEACRANLRALTVGGVPHVANNWTDPGSPNTLRDVANIATDNPYPINIVHLNADTTPIFRGTMPHYAAERRNIGYWTWELEWFPEEWRHFAATYDEIWVPTTFVRDAVASRTDKPVRVVPHPVSLRSTTPKYSREEFHLPKAPYLFLFMFDFQSSIDRKNPMAVIRAFRQAFGGRRDVGLVLKMLPHASVATADRAEVLQAAAGRANIHFVTGALDRERVTDLMRLCDAYVSLHRSEGFGLTLAEAMALGKPVIATGYSGNLDFMNDNNSLLVRHTLIPLERDFGPYRKGKLWADASVDHAAELMDRLVADRALGDRLGRQARNDIDATLHPAVIAGNMLSHLTRFAAAA